MRTVERKWNRLLLASVISVTLTWFSSSTVLADQNEKTKERPVAEKNDDAKAALDAAKKAARQDITKARQTAEDERKADPAWKPSHFQQAVIRINQGTTKRITLNNFCLNTDGNILAACSGEASEIRILSPAGSLLKTWPMNFKPEAICVAADGTIFVAGAGRMAKLDQHGSILLEAATPQMAELPSMPSLSVKKTPTKEDKAAETAGKKRLAELKAKLEKAQKAYRKAIDDNRLPTNPTSEQIKERQQKLKGPRDALVAAQKESQDAGVSPDARAAQQRAEIQRKATIAGIAVTKNDVFVSCSMTKGYGFAVWRVDRNFTNPKRIIEGLRGCCGQMDIQAKDGDLWIAHNAQHKVERYNRDGRLLFSFGRTDRKKADGFGGCCEPKNLRFGSKGDLYVTESGPPVAIKRFTTDGKFLGVVGLPTYNSGCVRVTIEVSRDGRQVFILNPGENAIHVLTQ